MSLLRRFAVGGLDWLVIRMYFRRFASVTLFPGSASPGPQDMAVPELQLVAGKGDWM